jgi:hypothetical protein
VVPIATDAVSRGAQRLPQRGGLAKRVAKTQVNAKTFRGPNLIGVRLTAARNALKDPNAVNRGRVRRPTYGHKPYVIQLVPTGFYSDPLFDLKPEVRRRLEAAKREAISKF